MDPNKWRCHKCICGTTDVYNFMPYRIRISTFKYINQLDAKTFQVYYLTFMYSSTSSGRPHPHHQDPNNCSSSFCFYRWSVVIKSMCGRPDHDQQHWYHHAPTVKPEAATAVVELLMMGVRTPESCWAVHTSKRQVIIIIIIIIINIQGWAIWPVPSPELKLLSPSFFRSPNCSFSLWAVKVWF
jgi:hypothetical protein